MRSPTILISFEQIIGSDLAQLPTREFQAPAWEVLVSVVPPNHAGGNWNDGLQLKWHIALLDLHTLIGHPPTYEDVYGRNRELYYALHQAGRKRDTQHSVQVALTLIHFQKIYAKIHGALCLLGYLSVTYQAVH